MKFKLFLGLALSLAFFSSCGHKEKDSTQAPVRVETMTVSETSVNGSRSYSGVIEESTGTTLSFKAPGTISQLNVTEGQRVSKGQSRKIPRMRSSPFSTLLNSRSASR